MNCSKDCVQKIYRIVQEFLWCSQKTHAKTKNLRTRTNFNNPYMDSFIKFSRGFFHEFLRRVLKRFFYKITHALLSKLLQSSMRNCYMYFIRNPYWDSFRKWFQWFVSKNQINWIPSEKCKISFKLKKKTKKKCFRNFAKKKSLEHLLKFLKIIFQKFMKVSFKNSCKVSFINFFRDSLGKFSEDSFQNYTMDTFRNYPVNRSFLRGCIPCVDLNIVFFLA